MTVKVADSETVASFAVTFADACAVTAFVAIANVADVAPAATFALAGTVTELKLLVSDTVVPPVGATPLSVTVPVELEPPLTEAGLRVRPVRTAGVIVSDVPMEDEPRLAVTFAAVELATDAVAIVNVAEVAPAETVTLEGTVAALWLLANLTVNPPEGAADEILSVPVDVAPPETLVGLIDSEDSFGAVMVRVAETAVVPNVPLIVAVVFDATGTVCTGNVAVVAPLGTVTESPTVAAVADEVSLTSTPSPLAFFESVTIPVADDPPTTLAGDRLNLLTV